MQGGRHSDEDDEWGDVCGQAQLLPRWLRGKLPPSPSPITACASLCVAMHWSLSCQGYALSQHAIQTHLGILTEWFTYAVHAVYGRLTLRAFVASARQTRRCPIAVWQSLWTPRDPRSELVCSKEWVLGKHAVTAHMWHTTRVHTYIDTYVRTHPVVLCIF